MLLFSFQILLFSRFPTTLFINFESDKLQNIDEEFLGPNGFRGKHLGKLNWFLGMGIEQNEKYEVFVDQETYIQKLLEKFVPNFQSGSIKHAMPCNPETFEKLGIAKSDMEREKMKKN